MALPEQLAPQATSLRPLLSSVCTHLLVITHAYEEMIVFCLVVFFLIMYSVFFLFLPASGRG